MSFSIPFKHASRSVSYYLESFFQLAPLSVRLLAGFGAFTVTSAVLKSFAFLFLPHLLPSRLAKFKRRGELEGKKHPWAIVTGATDGIGKGFVFELAAQGFDVVICGRNRVKLESVVTELKEEFPKTNTMIFVAEASDVYKKGDGALPFEVLVKMVAELPVTVLVNNVGIAHDLVDLETLPAEEVIKVISINDTFPTLITQHLIPILEENGPSLILNVGSYASEMVMPYLSVYSGSKAYNKAWSAALSVELKARKSKIQVQSLLVGSVSSNSNRSEISLSCPSPRQFAKSALRVPTTAKVIAPYFWHKLGAGVGYLLPEGILERFMASQVDSMKKIMGGSAISEKEKKKSK